MKKIILFLCLLMPFVSYSFDGSDSTSTIKVNMGTLNKTASVYLLYQIDGEMIIDSAEYKEGYHIFNNKINRPLNARLIADPDRVGIEGLKRKNNADIDGLRFYMHPGLIVIKTERLIANAVFEVSDVNLDNIRLETMIKPIKDQVSSIKELLASADEPQISSRLNGQIDSLNSEKRLVLKKFIQENPNSFIALLSLYEYAGLDIDLKVIEPMFSKLSFAIRNTLLGKEFHLLMENKKNLIVGSKAPEFTQNDTLGRPVSLSSFRGQYVLLDFWASWCGPCREENPNLRSIYKDFKDRNFTILGISLDNTTRRAAWIQAIKDDELLWTQVSDLKQWENQAAKLYSIRSIPQNFLINPQGIIIAMGISSEELRIKLEKELPVK